jgi:hypothetical protein
VGLSRDLTMPSRICVLCDVGCRLGQRVLLSFFHFLPSCVFCLFLSFVSPVPACGRMPEPWSGKCRPVLDAGILYRSEWIVCDDFFFNGK